MDQVLRGMRRTAARRMGISVRRYLYARGGDVIKGDWIVRSFVRLSVYPSPLSLVLVVSASVGFALVVTANRQIYHVWCGAVTNDLATDPQMTPPPTRLGTREKRGGVWGRRKYRRREGGTRPWG